MCEMRSKPAINVFDLRGADEMSDELSNNQISLLCNIGDNARPLTDCDQV